MKSIWPDLGADIDQFHQNGFIDKRWSCGVTKCINNGDRVFLIKIGRQPPKGIMASGHVTASPYLEPHYAIQGINALYINVRINWITNPYNNNLIELGYLKNEFPNSRWTPQNSGIRIRAADAERLDVILAHLRQQ